MMSLVHAYISFSTSILHALQPDVCTFQSNNNTYIKQG